MKLCTECKGQQVLENGQPIVPPNSDTTVTVKTAPQTVCPSCLGTGNINGFGAS